MIGGWLSLRNPLAKVMFGNRKNGFQTKKESFSAMTVVIALGANHNYIKTNPFHYHVKGICLFIIADGKGGYFPIYSSPCVMPMRFDTPYREYVCNKLFRGWCKSIFFQW